MNVSPNALRKETVETLKEINRQLELVGTSTPVGVTLLLAKTQCLNTLVLLNEKRN